MSAHYEATAVENVQWDYVGPDEDDKLEALAEAADIDPGQAVFAIGQPDSWHLITGTPEQLIRELTGILNGLTLAVKEVTP